MRPEPEIREKIENSLEALKDFINKEDSTPEEFFTVARQATYLTALYWVLGENLPAEVQHLAVPIIAKMGEVQAKGEGQLKEAAEAAKWAGAKDADKK
jgi:hypothetical protein